MIAPLQRAVDEKNYVAPTAIQAQAIPAALRGRDVLGCAQTGTGKTAAFALPVLNALGRKHRNSLPNRPFVLVLAPTRELAIQIGESLATYGRHLPVRQALVYGGVNQSSQVRTLERGAHILVATPGRLIDLIDQGHIELNALEIFVLDEADRMLDMGFLPDLKRIITRLPDRRQSLFFSATLPPNIYALSEQLLTAPVSVNVTPKSPSVTKIAQRVLFVEQRRKQAILEGILRDPDVSQALVFTRTKRVANQVSKQLVRGGIGATVIHGNKSQSARQTALLAFRRKQVRVLVATDVAARGIDVDGITHVVNFDMPVEPENYVHRIGRTGRAGASGVALSFCCAAERRELKAIERLIGQKVPVDDSHATTESATTIDRCRKPGTGRTQTHPDRSRPCKMESGATRRPGEPRKRRRRRKPQERNRRSGAHT